MATVQCGGPPTRATHVTMPARLLRGDVLQCGAASAGARGRRGVCGEPAHLPLGPSRFSWAPTCCFCAFSPWFSGFLLSRSVEKTGSRVILQQQFSRSVAENSKVCRLKAGRFQKGRGRILTIGETHTQIPKVLEEKSTRGPVYKRRFLGEDCRSQPSLNSPLGRSQRAMCRFLETGQALVISRMELSR